jgi:hypothetical protein
MTVLLAKAFSPFHFKGDHLITLHVIDDLGFDNSLDIFSNGQVVVTFRHRIRQQDFGEFHFITGVAGDPGNVQSLVFLDPELLAGYFHNC